MIGTPTTWTTDYSNSHETQVTSRKPDSKLYFKISTCLTQSYTSTYDESSSTLTIKTIDPIPSDQLDKIKKVT